MKRTLILVLSVMLFTQQAFSCSTFFINHNGQMVFGRNYDWVAGTGLVCTNQRGLFKTSFQVGDSNTISWTSRYGSLTFNQYGKEFPTGGMNEKGLVVELMWLDETSYPKQDKRPALSVLQWIQYQMDNSSTVEEVIATDKVLRISSDGTPLHYLVADAGGAAATIEFLDVKMVVHKGSQLPFPVLTNSVYAESARHAKVALENNQQGDKSSLGRFVKACSMVREYQSGKSKGSLIDHSFSILQAVSQGDYTKWSIVYDIGNRKVYFRTSASPQVRSVAFSAFEFSCGRKALALNMNQAGKGDASGLFKPLTPELNRSIIHQTAGLSQSHVNISPSTQEAMARYASLIICK